MTQVHYTPKIATHWAPAQAEATYYRIATSAETMTEDQITEKVQTLMAAADAEYARVKIWDPNMRETRDRIFAQMGDSYSEMAAIWIMVSQYSTT